MDTCNVKLFKLGAINEAEIEEADKEWMPPLSWNETVLFARLGYHKYFKVNYEVDSMLNLQQKKDVWYKFDYLFNWEDHQVGVFIDNNLNTTQPFHMG